MGLGCWSCGPFPSPVHVSVHMCPLDPASVWETWISFFFFDFNHKTQVSLHGKLPAGGQMSRWYSRDHSVSGSASQGTAEDPFPALALGHVPQVKLGLSVQPAPQERESKPRGDPGS